MNKWDKRFMDLAFEIGNWSSCYKENRQVGAVNVKDKRILATGYNGAPSGVFSCKDKGFCMRIEENIPSGTQLEKCYAIHAEQNAIIQAAKVGVPIDGATLYCTHKPCTICTKMIINVGIKKVVYGVDYPDEFSERLFEEAKVELCKYEGELNI